MMKRIIIVVALASLMMSGCVVHRVPQAAAKIPITAQPKPEKPKPDPEKQTITYRITIIIREVVVENVDDINSMLPEDKKQEKKEGGVLLAN
jgi:hypothetical protein